MKFEYWLRRQGKTLNYIIEKNKIKSYTDLVNYCNSLSLIPPKESDVSEHFKKKKETRKRGSNLRVRKTTRKAKAVSSRNNTKRKSDKRENGDSVRRTAKQQKIDKSLDDKKVSIDRDNSSEE